MIQDDPSIIKPTLTKLRQAFFQNKTRSFAWRKQQLIRLLQGIEDNAAEIHKALDSDLGYKNPATTKLFSIAPVTSNLKYLIEHFESYAKPRNVDTNLIVGFGSSKIVPEPYGVCLVMGAWNYPLFTTIGPAYEAIAAGNCVAMKPSELSPKCSNVMKKIFEKYLDTDCFAVIEGGAKVAEAITKEQWDLIIFTGSPQKGKLVAKAAAENLIPCILELGGKNPTIIDSNADINNAALRIAICKYGNAGQTCIAPDFVMVHKAVKQQFIDELKKAIVKFYGNNIQASTDYSRVVTEFHTERLVKMMQESSHGGKVVFGGKNDVKDRYLEPTIVVDPKEDSQLMQEEIFGPILPILSYESLDEVIYFIQRRPKPLALYYFGSSQQHIQKIELQTSSGAFVINDCIMHVMNHRLPFGGVGNSGYGAVHSKQGFDNCSHMKPVLKSLCYNGFPLNVRFPPYTSSQVKTTGLVFKFGNIFPKEILVGLFRLILILAIFYFVFNYAQKNNYI